MTQETWHSPISLKRKMVKARIADVQMGRLRRYQITEGQASYSKIRNNNKMNWRDITARTASSPGLFCCSLFLEGGAQELGCVATDVCDWTVSHFLSTSSFSFEIWSLFRHSYLSLTPSLVRRAEIYFVRTTDCKHSSDGSCPKFSEKPDAHNDLWYFVHVIDQSDFRIGKGISSACLHWDTG